MQNVIAAHVPLQCVDAWWSVIVTIIHPEISIIILGILLVRLTCMFYCWVLETAYDKKILLLNDLSSLLAATFSVNATKDGRIQSEAIVASCQRRNI